MSTPATIGDVERAPSFALRRSLLAIAVATQGAIDLASAFLSHPSERLLALRRLVPTSVIDTSRTFTLLAGALLLLTAWGLRRGKRRAYVAALFLAALSVPFNLFKAIDVEEATVASALMFALGVNAEAFRVKSRELTWSALRAPVVWMGLGFVFYAVVGCWIVEARYGNGASIVRAVSETLYRTLGLGSPSLVLDPTLSHHVKRMVGWFLESLPVLGFTLLVGAAFLALQPAIHRRRHRADRDRAAEIIAKHAVSALAPFALAPDCDYFFSRTGRAVIAYKFQSGTLLAIGDPIGPPEEFPSLLRDFARYVEERDWTFGFFQSLPEVQPQYRRLGWSSVHIGEEPVLRLADFTLEGAEMGDVRRSWNKLKREGFEARHFRPRENPFEAAGAMGLEGEIARQLAAVSAEWLRSHPGEEKGFCMGRFDIHHLREVWLAVAWNPAARRVEGFLTWTAMPARGGWALDLMRRRGDAPSGTMEFLVADCAEEAKRRGESALSLSLSALAKAEGPAADGEPTAVTRARALLVKHLTRFYPFEGLFRWKAKFRPAFEPRYLVVAYPSALPRVALALAQAQSPGGLRAYFGGRERVPETGNPPPGEGV